VKTACRIAVVRFQHDGAGTIAEHQRAQQVVDGAVIRTEGQRWQLDSNDQCLLPGVRANPVGGARQTAGTAGAAKLRHRQPPDVRAKAQLRKEVRVEPWKDEAGAGRDDQEPDGLATVAGGGDGSLRRRGCQCWCSLDISGGLLAEREGHDHLGGLPQEVAIAVVERIDEQGCPSRQLRPDAGQHLHHLLAADPARWRGRPHPR